MTVTFLHFFHHQKRKKIIQHMEIGGGEDADFAGGLRYRRRLIDYQPL